MCSPVVQNGFSSSKNLGSGLKLDTEALAQEGLAPSRQQQPEVLDRYCHHLL